MARKFLYFIAVLIVLVIAAVFALRLYWDDLAEIVYVPQTEFVEQQPLEINAYQDPAMWLSRPGIGLDDAARWQPAMRGEGRQLPDGDEPKQDFAVFFVHPTSYLDSAHWNAPLDDEQSQRIARIYVRGMASPFNQASEIWAPRYRQATFGAFLTDSAEAQQAIDAAYDDVKQAFDFFMSSVDEDLPIVLVGHSQGTLHLLRLLREEDLANSLLAGRVAAIYAVGWPISIERDLPALGFPACATPSQAGCIMSWSTFAEPADPTRVIDAYSGSLGFDGEMRGDTPILCTNPLTGGIGGEAPAEANLGTLIPSADYSTGELVPGAVPARCSERGLLLIGDPPEIGSAVLPGNNYHVYDIPLFWENVKQDVANRVEAWAARP